MYAIRVTEDTVHFIAKFLNDGVVPVLEEGKNYFLFGDENRPSEIISETEFDSRFGATILIPNVPLYRVY